MKDKNIIVDKEKILKRFYSTAFSFARNRQFVLDNMKIIKDDLQLRQTSLSEIIENELFRLSKEPYTVDHIDVKRKMKKDLGNDKYDEIKNQMKDLIVYVEEETIKDEISRLLGVKQQNSVELKLLKKKVSLFNRLKSLFVKYDENYFADVRTQIRFFETAQSKINKEVQAYVKDLKRVKKSK